MSNLNLGQYVYYVRYHYDKTFASIFSEFTHVDYNQGMIVAIHNDRLTLKLNSIFYKTVCINKNDCFSTKELLVKFLSSGERENA